MGMLLKQAALTSCWSTRHFYCPAASLTLALKSAIMRH